MRYVSAMLFLVLFSTPAFSGEMADIQAVERELRLEKEARDIYKRAKKRAARAVRNSSLGEMERKMNLKLKRENEKREFNELGLGKKSDVVWSEIKRLQVENRTHKRRFGTESLDITRQLKEYLVSIDTMLAKMKQSQKEAKKLLREYKVLVGRLNRMERKITSIFLADEIKKLRKKKSSIVPEIERLMKKQKKAEVI